MTSFELKNFIENWNFGILNDELFANFDDDNGAYGESLIKRGIYPFDTNQEVNLIQTNHISFILKLNAGDFYDCAYYSRKHRIKILPRVFFRVNQGKIKINYNNKDILFIQNLLYCDIQINDIISIHDKYKFSLFISIHDFIWLCQEQHQYTNDIPSAYLNNNINVSQDITNLLLLAM